MALRYWKRLNGDERMMAVASIDVYLDSKPRSRWRTAVEYLGYKSFCPTLTDNKFRVTATFSVCLIQIYLNVISHDKFQ